MPSRLDLQTKLEKLIGSRNVYYQPPESLKMNYPAIVYGLDNIKNSYANDGVYLFKNRYSVVVIDKNPDSKIVGKIALLPFCQYSRHFETDNLNHDVFILHF